MQANKLEGKVFSMSVDPADRSTEVAVKATMVMNHNGIPHLAAFQRNDIMVLIGDCDEMLTGYLVNHQGLITEGSNFAELERKLYSMCDELKEEGILEKFV